MATWLVARWNKLTYPAALSPSPDTPSATPQPPFGRSAKVIRVLIAQALADLVDVEFGGAEELTGLLHFQFLKKVHGGVTGGFLENQVQIALGELKLLGERTQGKIFIQVAVHIADHRRHMAVLLRHGILFLPVVGFR